MLSGKDPGKFGIAGSVSKIRRRQLKANSSFRINHIAQNDFVVFCLLLSRSATRNPRNLTTCHLRTEGVQFQQEALPLLRGGFGCRDQGPAPCGLLTFTVTSCVDLRTSELLSIRSDTLPTVRQDLPGEKGKDLKKQLKILWK